MLKGLFYTTFVIRFLAIVLLLIGGMIQKNYFYLFLGLLFCIFAFLDVRKITTEKNKCLASR